MKRIFAIIFSILMLLSLCACGAKSANSALREDYYVSSPAEAPMPEPEMAADEAGGGFAMNGMKAEDAPSADEPQKDTLQPEKIIYSADATVETTEFEQTLEKLQALVQQYGGFIESSSINGSNYYSQARGYSNSRSAYYTIRIPSARFTDLMGSLSTLGNVPYTHSYTENITARYYDVQARLTAYQTQEQRLLEMMEKAETVSDIIVIEDRLTELRYQIESLQSSLNNWDRQVNYSTVNVNVSEVTVYTPEATLTYGQRLGLAVRNGLKGTAEFFSEFLLWFLEALPALVILAALIVLVIVIVRKTRKKRRARKAAEKAAKE